MNKYSIYWYDVNDNQYKEIYLEKDLDIIESTVMRLIEGPASKRGIVKKVMIVVNEDYITFEWENGKGIIYPKFIKGD